LNKGIIIEKYGKRALVLTPEGEFKKIKLNNTAADIGEEVVFSPSIYSMSKFAVTAAAILLLFILPVTVFQVSQASVAAYVTVDINPSVELALNNNLRVRRVTALNSDGEILIKQLPLKNKPLGDALKMLIDGAIDTGYISKDEENEVLVAAVSLNNSHEKSEQIIKTVEDAESFIDTTGYKINYEVMEAEKQTLNEAQDLGISAGKYMIYKEAKDQGLDIDPEKLKKDGIGKTLKEKGTSPGELIKKAKTKNKKHQETPKKSDDKYEEVKKPTAKDNDYNKLNKYKELENNGKWSKDVKKNDSKGNKGDKEDKDTKKDIDKNKNGENDISIKDHKGNNAGKDNKSDKKDKDDKKDKGNKNDKGNSDTGDTRIKQPVSPKDRDKNKTGRIKAWQIKMKAIVAKVTDRKITKFVQ
jgi:hypothetical protein